jgi:hypothetical protein
VALDVESLTIKGKKSAGVVCGFLVESKAAWRDQVFTYYGKR